MDLKEACRAFAIAHDAEFEPVLIAAADPKDPPVAVAGWWQFRWPADYPRRPTELTVAGEMQGALDLAIESVRAGRVPGVTLDEEWDA